MSITHKLAVARKNRNYNRSVMTTILNLARERIVKQDSGCFIPDLGTSYFDKKSGKRDAIANLLTGTPINWGNFYGLISDESQKPIVRAIIKKFQPDLSKGDEHMKFVDFLQDLQDAHDKAFDEYEEKDDFFRVGRFLGYCKDVSEKFKLGV